MIDHPERTMHDVPVPAEVTNFDRNVLKSRPYVLGAILAGLFVDTVVALNFPASFPIMAASEVALAIGTLALAYGALLQLASTVVTRRDEAMWRAQQRADRARDREPNVIVGLRPLPTVRKSISTDPADPPDKMVVSQFDEAELFIENVGPGIASGLSARVVTLYRDVQPSDWRPDPDNPDPARQCVGPDDLLDEEHGFHEAPYGLPSSYLAIGPDNRMRLFKPDEWEQWSGNESMEDDRAYIVIVEYTDLEHNQSKKVVGGAYWVPKIPGLRGDPEDYDDTFLTRSRWFQSRSDLIDKVLADYEKWKTASKKRALEEQLDALGGLSPASESITK